MRAEIKSKYGADSNNPKKVVIHAMAEFIEGGEGDFFAKDLLDNLGLSAHYLICPSGVVIQCRGDYEGAYHAKGHNKDSIGIEILVPGIHTYGTFIERIKTPYHTGEQYTSLVKLCREYKRLPFVRHSDIDPERIVTGKQNFNSY